jgi:hypothetical protein
MFEMIVGYPPFYSEDPVSTCRKIVQWQTFVKFPEQPVVSEVAKDFIRRLLCGVENRYVHQYVCFSCFYRFPLNSFVSLMSPVSQFLFVLSQNPCTQGGGKSSHEIHPIHAHVDLSKAF